MDNSHTKNNRNQLIALNKAIYSNKIKFSVEENSFSIPNNTLDDKNTFSISEMKRVKRTKNSDLSQHFEEPIKKMQKVQVNTRMQKWRYKNSEKNKLNDLRCRVYRIAKAKFGDVESSEAIDFIIKEIRIRVKKKTFRDAKKLKEFCLETLTSDVADPFKKIYSLSMEFGITEDLVKSVEPIVMQFFETKKNIKSNIKPTFNSQNFHPNKGKRVFSQIDADSILKEKTHIRRVFSANTNIDDFSSSKTTFYTPLNFLYNSLNAAIANTCKDICDYISKAACTDTKIFGGLASHSKKQDEINLTKSSSGCESDKKKIQIQKNKQFNDNVYNQYDLSENLNIYKNTRLYNTPEGTTSNQICLSTSLSKLSKEEKNELIEKNQPKNQRSPDAFTNFLSGLKSGYNSDGSYKAGKTSETNSNSVFTLESYPNTLQDALNQNSEFDKFMESNKTTQKSEIFDMCSMQLYNQCTQQNSLKENSLEAFKNVNSIFEYINPPSDNYNQIINLNSFSAQSTNGNSLSINKQSSIDKIFNFYENKKQISTINSKNYCENFSQNFHLNGYHESSNNIDIFKHLKTIQATINNMDNSHTKNNRNQLIALNKAIYSNKIKFSVEENSFSIPNNTLDDKNTFSISEMKRVKRTKNSDLSQHFEEPIKKMQKVQVNTRMQKWRYKNSEKNKLNDLRCRVYRIAKAKFGDVESSEAIDFIIKEIRIRVKKKTFRDAKKLKEFCLETLTSDVDDPFKKIYSLSMEFGITEDLVKSVEPIVMQFFETKKNIKSNIKPTFNSQNFHPNKGKRVFSQIDADSILKEKTHIRRVFSANTNIDDFSSSKTTFYTPLNFLYNSLNAAIANTCKDICDYISKAACTDTKIFGGLASHSKKQDEINLIKSSSGCESDKKKIQIQKNKQFNDNVYNQYDLSENLNIYKNTRLYNKSEGTAANQICLSTSLSKLSKEEKNELIEKNQPKNQRSPDAFTNFLSGLKSGYNSDGSYKVGKTSETNSNSVFTLESYPNTLQDVLNQNSEFEKFMESNKTTQKSEIFDMCSMQLYNQCTQQNSLKENSLEAFKNVNSIFEYINPPSDNYNQIINLNSFSAQSTNGNSLSINKQSSIDKIFNFYENKKQISTINSKNYCENFSQNFHLNGYHESSNNIDIFKHVNSESQNEERVEMNLEDIISQNQNIFNGVSNLDENSSYNFEDIFNSTNINQAIENKPLSTINYNYNFNIDNIFFQEGLTSNSFPTNIDKADQNIAINSNKENKNNFFFCHLQPDLSQSQAQV
ncbi:hypothetical protein BB561_005903 [Smittium simulii]|uniref:DUF3020 domain-containing protein n=1 Tax=Smittium simulii TaxID=133385 RepID=A0A2T9Y7Q4_9FUNG|nr:hypothetical protein BB561_005903 [Smittium simulii]